MLSNNNKIKYHTFAKGKKRKKRRVSRYLFSASNGKDLLGRDSEPNEDNGKEPDDFSGTKSSH